MLSKVVEILSFINDRSSLQTRINKKGIRNSLVHILVNVRLELDSGTDVTSNDTQSLLFHFLYSS
jgi:hypothetical protein